MNLEHGAPRWNKFGRSPATKDDYDATAVKKPSDEFGHYQTKDGDDK